MANPPDPSSVFASSLLPSPFIVIAGPTAVGKSEVGLRAAELLNGEIVSVDSMQVYRGLDIGTAKPSAADRARVPHHLIDVVEVTQSFDAAKFVRIAQNVVREIQSRKHLPILCGGTGFYFKALIDGIGSALQSDAGLRACLEAAPLDDLLRELAERDPATYKKIDRQNPRRVIRALEVIRLTGKPFSAQRPEWKRGMQTEAQFFGLSRSSSDLRDRIDARVDEMFRRGLVAETESLLKLGLENSKTAMQALGYRQIVEHLNGVRSLADTVALVKIRTRQFAKRQMTWFRGQMRLHWLHIESRESAEDIAKRVVSRCSTS